MGSGIGIHMISLGDWNIVSEREALEMLRKCSPSLKWAGGVVASRPYLGLPELLAAARDQWSLLAPGDWIDLIAAHDRLAEADSGGLSAESKGEQAAIYESDPDELEKLASAARVYEQRFGFIFVTAVRGRKAGEVLTEIDERTRNDKAMELSVASERLKSIAEGRLRRMFSGEGL